MTWLLDGSVLVALVLDRHVDHTRVKRWLEPLTESFATCAVTQGTLLRLHMRLAEDQTARAAWSVLRAIVEDPLHEYWNDGFGYTEVEHGLLQGPRQVTDAWLAELAHRHNARVATLDQGFATLYPDRVTLVPVL